MAQSTDTKVKAFFKLLTEDLRFEDSVKISSAKIQRLLENPATGPFLSEFIQTVTKDNILTPTELEQYNIIKTQGRTKVGDELQKAINQHEELNAAYIAQNKELELKMKNARLKKKRLEYELAQMNEMKKQQQKRLDGNLSLKKQSAQTLRDDKNENISTSEQISETVNSLDATFQSLCGIVEKVDGKSYLLSQVDLQDLIIAEEKYNSQLTNFVKKQFFEISQTIAEDLNEQENCHKLHSLNDENLFASESEEIKHTIANAVRRARHGYPDREKKLISVQAQESAAQTALSFLHQKRTEIQQNHPQITAEDLRESIDETVSKTKEVKEEVHKLSHVQIPNLISEGTPLQTTHLLTGDYRRKWIRQQYFIEKQQKVISLLQQQQARLDLLWKLLLVEEVGHEKTGEQVDVVLNHLQAMLNEGMAESEWFEKNQQGKVDTTTKSVFNENDKLAISTHKMLGIEEAGSIDPDSTIFHPFNTLSDASHNLYKCLNDLRKVSNMSPGSHPEEVVLNDMSDAMSNCKSLLQTQNSQHDSGDHDNVVLTPDEVTEMTNHIQSEFQNLSGIVTRCTKEIDQKKNFLQYNERAAKMRTLWIDFHLNPSKLPKLDVED
ncbi:HAUS augmin-like complex subunit 3 [Styela clava]